MKNNYEIRVEYNITDRQIEYLILASFGFSNAKIAEILCVKKTTVKKSLEEIFLRLNAIDRTSMVNNAWRYKILNKNIEDEIANKYNINLPVKYIERYAAERKSKLHIPLRLLK